jgi:hypothetical protein
MINCNRFNEDTDSDSESDDEDSQVGLIRLMQDRLDIGMRPIVPAYGPDDACYAEDSYNICLLTSQLFLGYASTNSPQRRQISSIADYTATYDGHVFVIHGAMIPIGHNLLWYRKKIIPFSFHLIS